MALSEALQLYYESWPQGKPLGRPTKGTERLISVGTALTAAEIGQVDAISTIGTRSSKLRVLILKALGE